MAVQTSRAGRQVRDGQQHVQLVTVRWNRQEQDDWNAVAHEL